MTWSHQLSQPPAPLGPHPAMAGSQSSPQRSRWVRGQSCSTDSAVTLGIAISNGCSIWPREKILYLCLEMVSFFSWNLHQWWYMLVCLLLRSRIESYPNGDIDVSKGLQVCWDRWTYNRGGQTWCHVESTLSSNPCALVTCAESCGLCTFCKGMLLVAWNPQDSPFSRIWLKHYNTLPFIER